MRRLSALSLLLSLSCFTFLFVHGIVYCIATKHGKFKCDYQEGSWRHAKHDEENSWNVGDTVLVTRDFTTSRSEIRKDMYGKIVSIYYDGDLGIRFGTREHFVHPVQFDNLQKYGQDSHGAGVSTQPNSTVTSEFPTSRSVASGGTQAEGSHVHDGGDTSIASEEILYLPKTVNGHEVMVPEAHGMWRADNSSLQAGASELGYRKSKHLGDRADKGIRWGDSVRGQDEGDWVKCVVKSDLVKEALQTIPEPGESRFVEQSTSTTASMPGHTIQSQNLQEALQSPKSAPASAGGSRETSRAARIAPEITDSIPETELRASQQQDRSSPLGLYVIERDAWVTDVCSINGKKIAELFAGNRVTVLETETLGTRQWARIAEPAGWISLVKADEGYCWARKATEDKAIEDQSCSSGNSLPPSPRKPNELAERVLVTCRRWTGRKPGMLRWKGFCQGRDRYGVELDEPIGLCGGCFNGVRYFWCEKEEGLHGIFALPSQVEFLSHAEMTPQVEAGEKDGDEHQSRDVEVDGLVQLENDAQVAEVDGSEVDGPEARRMSEAVEQASVAEQAQHGPRMGQAESERSPSEENHYLCPNGHPLTEIETHHDEFACDACDKSVAKGTKMFSCRECDYDICTECNQQAQRWSSYSI